MTDYERGVEQATAIYKEIIREYVSENAKLRELVYILYYCGLPYKDCDKCAMNGVEMHVQISDIEYCDGMYDRMRELGIEVGDD